MALKGTGEMCPLGAAALYIQVQIIYMHYSLNEENEPVLYRQ